MEKQQEAMLKSKYPQLNRAPGGGSALLHKRLHKGVSAHILVVKLGIHIRGICDHCHEH